MLYESASQASVSWTAHAARKDEKPKQASMSCIQSHIQPPKAGLRVGHAFWSIRGES